jgi:hypothetical protein
MCSAQLHALHAITDCYFNWNIPSSRMLTFFASVLSLTLCSAGPMDLSTHQSKWVSSPRRTLAMAAALTTEAPKVRVPFILRSSLQVLSF